MINGIVLGVNPSFLRRKAGLVIRIQLEAQWVGRGGSHSNRPYDTCVHTRAHDTHLFLGGGGGRLKYPTE